MATSRSIPQQSGVPDREPDRALAVGATVALTSRPVDGRAWVGRSGGHQASAGRPRRTRPRLSETNVERAAYPGTETAQAKCPYPERLNGRGGENGAPVVNERSGWPRSPHHSRGAAPDCRRRAVVSARKRQRRIHPLRGRGDMHSSGREERSLRWPAGWAHDATRASATAGIAGASVRAP